MSDSANRDKPGDGAHPFGANQASAYVPPQVVRAKPKPVIDAEKVRINAPVDPRHAKTLPRAGGRPAAGPPGPRAAPPSPPGTPPAADVTPQSPVVTPPSPVVTPFGPSPQAPTEPAAARPPDALPFRAAGSAAQPAPTAVVVAGPAPARRRPMPQQLTSPGVLTPLGTPPSGGPTSPPVVRLAQAAPGAPLPSTGSAALATPPGVAQGGGATIDPGTAAATGARADEHPLAVTDSPWTQRSRGAANGGAQPSAAPAAAGRADDHPLAVTNSPWSKTQSVAADLLPSANVVIPAADAPPEPVPAAPVSGRRGGSSRVLMTIGLAVAALALVAAIVYLTLSKRRGSEDPADVKAGQAQKSYDDEPQAPTATATASAKAPPKPKGNWPSKGGKKKESDDFYDHL